MAERSTPAAAAGSRRSGQGLLGIYLNDHLAGATGGVELARRAARAHRGPAAASLKQLAAEIAQDRVVLLKLNGRLLARSPLSSLVELEALRLGVEGKAAGWRTLRVLAGTDERLAPARLDELITSARRQADLLEELRVRAASQVTGTDGAAGDVSHTG